MASFLVYRDVTDWTEEDVFAAAVRARMCVARWDGLLWRSSFYDRAAGRVTCWVDADDEADVWEHARYSGLPISEVHPVLLIDPDGLGVEAPDTSARVEEQTPV